MPKVELDENLLDDGTGREVFINPFTDFGFKKIFGQEYNKDLLIDFLNQLLRRDKSPIKDLYYISSEQMPHMPTERRAVFDISCKTDSGENFIVEMQRSRQAYFKDRALYYAAFPIIGQALKGNWDFNLPPVYTVAILDFVFNDDEDKKEKYLYDVRLVELESQKIFYEKLRFVYIAMPKFNKRLAECNSRFEKWVYALKNMARMHHMPDSLKDKIFSKLFTEAAIANYSTAEFEAYKNSLKIMRDNYAVMKTQEDEVTSKVTAEVQAKMQAKMQAKIKAQQEGYELKIKAKDKKLQETSRKIKEQAKQFRSEKLKAAELFIKSGLPIELVAKNLGLSEDELKQLMK